MEFLQAMEDFSAGFSVIRQDGNDRKRAVRGYYMTCSAVGDARRGKLIFQRGISHAAVQRLVRELMLENALAGLGAGGAVWCLSDDPIRMNEEESRSLCFGFMDALHRNGLPFPPMDGACPLRERQYMMQRAALLRPWEYREPVTKTEPSGVSGRGLLYLAECVIRRLYSRGMWGLSLCVPGQTAAAAQAREQARRMGCVTAACEDAEVVLLFDAEGLTAVSEHLPLAVFEAAGVRTPLCIAESLMKQGVCLCPALVCGAGMAAYRAGQVSADPWQEERRLRHAMEDICTRVLKEGTDMYYGAYGAALRAAAEQ